MSYTKICESLFCFSDSLTVDPVEALEGLDLVFKEILELAGPEGVAAAWHVSSKWQKAVMRTIKGPR